MFILQIQWWILKVTQQIHSTMWLLYGRVNGWRGTVLWKGLHKQAYVGRQRLCPFNNHLTFILRRLLYKICYEQIHWFQTGNASAVPRVASSIYGPGMSYKLPGGSKKIQVAVSMLMEVTCLMLWSVFLPDTLQFWPSGLVRTKCIEISQLSLQQG